MTILAVVLCLAGCRYPDDTAGTLDRIVLTGELRAGVVEHRPWVRLVDGAPTGPEPILLERWARQRNATVHWYLGSETELVAALEEGEIDVLIGGFTRQSPWTTRVAPTLPYGFVRRVLLVRPGENALLFALDQFLAEAVR